MLTVTCTSLRIDFKEYNEHNALPARVLVAFLNDPSTRKYNHLLFCGNLPPCKNKYLGFINIKIALIAIPM